MIRLLFIEDDDRYFQWLTCQLDPERFFCLRVDDAEEAAMALRDGKYAACFLDLNMPKWSPQQAMALVRNADVPIVVLTGELARVNLLHAADMFYSKNEITVPEAQIPRIVDAAIRLRKKMGLSDKTRQLFAAFSALKHSHVL